MANEIIAEQQPRKEAFITKMRVTRAQVEELEDEIRERLVFTLGYTLSREYGDIELLSQGETVLSYCEEVDGEWFAIYKTDGEWLRTSDMSNGLPEEFLAFGRTEVEFIKKAAGE